MTRKPHVKNDYTKLRKKYRAASPRHVVEFEADLPEDTKRVMFRYANQVRLFGNDVVAEMSKRIEQMTRTKEYRNLLKDYGAHVKRMQNLDKESPEWDKLDAERIAIGNKLNRVQQNYGVTFDAVRSIGIKLQSKYGIGSIFALTRCEDIWGACQKVLYSNGKKLHFKKRNDLPIIRAKQANRGIPIKYKNDKLFFSMEGFTDFGVIVPKNDLFLKEEYQKIVEFLTSPAMEETAIKHLKETGEIIPVFRPCYASIKCVTIRRKLRVFVQVAIAAEAIPKRKRDGSLRHKFGVGIVGCDNGAQSFAAVANDTVILKNLAERDNKSTKRSIKRERILQQRLDRSTRAMNPDRFNEDGTPKRIRGPYKKSKHGRRLAYLLRERKRRDAATREYAIRTDAHRLRALGNVLIIEPSNARALQKRSTKATEVTDKTIEVKQRNGFVKTVAKFKRKKRFGKSIQYRCPGVFQAALKELFGFGYHEVSRKFRASQYDHKSDAYIKKKLSQRWHTFEDGTKVQRDLYSAFLMYCTNADYSSPDKSKCIQSFEKFYKNHDEEIKRIVDNHLIVCNSGITA